MLRFAMRCGSPFESLKSKHVDHLLAAVVGIADEFLAHGIDDEVEHLQRDLADEHRAFVWDFRDFDDAIALLDCQANRVVKSTLPNFGSRPRGAAARAL